MNPDRRISVCIRANAALVMLLAAFFFLIPGVLVLRDLLDPELQSGREL